MSVDTIQCASLYSDKKCSTSSVLHSFASNSPRRLCVPFPSLAFVQPRRFRSSLAASIRLWCSVSSTATLQALLRPAAARARLYATKAAKPLPSSSSTVKKPAAKAPKPEKPQQPRPAPMAPTVKAQPKKMATPSTSTAASAAPKSKSKKRPPTEAHQAPLAEQPRAVRLKKRKKPEFDYDLPLPDKLVRWRTVSVEWRAILESNVEAAKWRATNLTPNTLCTSPLANADGSISLFEGKTPNGQVRLFYSMEQINAARTAMLHRGVPKPWLQETWNDEWVWSAEQFKELRKIRFKNADGLRYRLAAMKTDRALDKAALEAARAQQKKSATPTEPTPAAPIEPVAATASAAYRKRLASATFLPTPSPSVESSPEPSSASNPSLPSQPKKPKATLTPAQEAAKLAREQASLVKWNKEFDLTQATWLRAQKEGGAAFLSLDVEMWEWDARCLLEFGWSVTEFIKEDDGSVMERRDDQHIIINEHLQRRNKRHVCDARDHFDFGTSVRLSLNATYNLLHATFETLSSNQPLFLIFHDPRADLRALHTLGFDYNAFTRSVATVAASKNPAVPREGLLVCDTQTLYSAWAGVPVQTGLGKCCVALDVPTKRLHNAGNDAVYTQIMFERMMNPSIPRPKPLVALQEAE